MQNDSLVNVSEVNDSDLNDCVGCTDSKAFFSHFEAHNVTANHFLVTS